MAEATLNPILWVTKHIDVTERNGFIKFLAVLLDIISSSLKLDSFSINRPKIAVDHFLCASYLKRTNHDSC